jgi:methylglutaconyl-CoA hydratase
MAFIEISEQNHIQTIHFNRPEVHNAFDPQMISELTDAFRAIQKHPTLRAVILAGHGKSFCAGADLRWMQSMANYNFQQNTEDSDKLFEMFWQMAICPVPLLGKIHGSVFGGALGLLAVCDIVAADVGTRFCFSEIKLGLVPAVISPFVASKVAPSKLRDWMLTGRVFDAAEAYAGGLIHYVGNVEERDIYLKDRIKNILDGGPEAIRVTKALLAQVLDLHKIIEHRTEAIRVISERRVSAEGQEGLMSFFEKRSPLWASEDRGVKP